MTKPPGDAVVLVHGIWMTGIDMSLLAYRIRHCGFRTFRFAYHSVRNSPEQNAERLQHFLERIDSPRIHFVAHSLGGLVVRHLFHLYPRQRPGNIVTIGTPHVSSQVAKSLSQYRWGKAILGKSLIDGLAGGAPPWHAANALGVIAGNRRVGAGRLIYRFSGENDGTVGVDETRLEGMSGHIIEYSSHTGLIYNRQVASEVCLFLEQARFSK